MIFRDRLNSKRSGFTLLELLIVIAVIGILAAIGFVNLQKFIRVNRLKEAQFQVSVAVNQTRDLVRRYGQRYDFRMSETQLRYYPKKLDNSTPKKMVQDTSTTAPPSGTAKYANGIKINTTVGVKGIFSIAPATTNADNEPEAGFEIFGPTGFFPASTQCLVLQSGSDSQDPKVAIKILAVTGKIVQSGVFYDLSDSPC
jgi:prepilin-type N-terminal cleavage/methylation domain-containing protein